MTQTRLASRTSEGQAELYNTVKAMAVRFDFKPGERINEVELARRLNVSRTPLREVLNQLMVEGFLTRAVNRGFIARLLDAKQIHSLYEYRAVLESGIVRAACERASDAELAELRAFVERSRDVPEDSEATRLLELDEAFHLMLARYSRNEEFVRALESVNARIHFVRWIDMQQGRRAHTQAEHMRIVQALERRDIEALPAMMGAHIGRRLDQITDVIRTGFPTSTCGTRPTPRRQRRPTPQQGNTDDPYVVQTRAGHGLRGGGDRRPGDGGRRGGRRAAVDPGGAVSAGRQHRYPGAHPAAAPVAGTGRARGRGRKSTGRRQSDRHGLRGRPNPMATRCW